MLFPGTASTLVFPFLPDIMHLEDGSEVEGMVSPEKKDSFCFQLWKGNEKSV